jgi:glyoxylase-like metal-dependent hydrolase (beta-lactamase superfamily II)
MEGRGHVTPGGRPLVEKLSSSMTLIKVSVGPMDNNAYLLQPSHGSAVLIDAANDHDRLLGILAGQPLETIITTHRHGDHWQALGRMAATTTARLVAGSPDVAAIAESTGVQALTGVWDGDRIGLGEEFLEVIALVGHTPGSITLAYAGEPSTHLFTGDSLFPGGPGRTTSKEDFTSLMDDLETKIFGRFNDDTVVHPGHGDDTTLGNERPHLPQWWARGW